MKPLTQDQRGLTYIMELVIIAALLAVIALAILAIIPHKPASTTPGASDQPGTTTGLTPTPTPDVTVGWKGYTSPGSQFSLKYPPAWVTDYISDSTGNYLILAASDKALKTPQNAHITGQISIGFLPKGTHTSADDYRQYDYNTAVSDQAVTINGLKGKRAEWVLDQGPLEADSPDRGKGSRTIYYRLEGAQYSYVARYDQFTSGPLAQDNQADFERLVRTIVAK